MRRLSALGAALAVAAASAGAGLAAQKPADVVRAWSAALNANRNDAAARLFAIPNAHVIQPGVDVRLATHAAAVGFNNALPCAGRIVRLDVDGRNVVATFVLGERPKHRCDGPGLKAAAHFVVQNGKIVLWEQVPVPKPKRKGVPA